MMNLESWRLYSLKIIVSSKIRCLIEEFVKVEIVKFYERK